MNNYSYFISSRNILNFYSDFKKRSEIIVISFFLEVESFKGSTRYSSRVIKR